MAEKKKDTADTAGDRVQKAAAESRAANRAANGIVVDESEPKAPADVDVTDLPTGARSHPPEGFPR